ncbi:MAG TPA: hypothetical protein VK814_11255 [Acidobacteriaceae bacterium]|jgi:hypothetical protein|nr:hypothetical protein [Acidobacteriaceae bacterium]
MRDFWNLSGKSAPISKRLFGLAAWACLFFLSNSVQALHAQGGACQIADYRILTPQAIAVSCNDLVLADGRTATITTAGALGSSPVNSTFDVHPFNVDEPSWLLLIASPAAGAFAFDQKSKYTITLTYQAPDPNNPGKTLSATESAFPLDLGGTVTVTPSKMASQPMHFTFTSHIGFVDSSGKLVYQESPGFAKLTKACSVLLENYSQKYIQMSGQCYKFTAVTDLSLAGIQNIDPHLVGVVDIDFQASGQLQSALLPMGLPTGPGVPATDIYGSKPAIDPKSRVSPQKAPSTKDASTYYFNVNYAAGTGTKPGWALDGKVAPVLAQAKGFTFGPSATANVGGNKVPGQTYTDTIDFSGTAQKVYQILRREPKIPCALHDDRHECRPAILQIVTFNSTVMYETDEEWDRSNLLGSVDIKYNFRHLYNTQSIKVLKRYYEISQKIELKHLPAGTIAPQLSDIPVPLFGYGLDFHTGIEAGGALVDKTVTASVGKAMLILPQYTIFRIVPQLHGILQIWKVSTDSTLLARYLVATENTVLQTPTNALYLEHLQTWRALLTVNTTYTESAASHFGVTIKYQNGFDAPKYARVNCVQAGLLVKF